MGIGGLVSIQCYLKILSLHTHTRTEHIQPTQTCPFCLLVAKRPFNKNCPLAALRQRGLHRSTLMSPSLSQDSIIYTAACAPGHPGPSGTRVRVPAVGQLLSSVCQEVMAPTVLRVQRPLPTGRWREVLPPSESSCSAGPVSLDSRHFQALTPVAMAMSPPAFLKPDPGADLGARATRPHAAVPTHRTQGVDCLGGCCKDGRGQTTLEAGPQRVSLALPGAES